MRARSWASRSGSSGATAGATRRKGLQGCSTNGKASARRVPIDQVSWMLSEYRTHYTGWTVKHFFDHLRKQHNFRWSYTWVKTQLHTARLVMPAPRRGAHRRKRPRKPCIGIVSRVTPVHTAVRNCTRDEGRPFEIGNQVLISSHRKLLSSKAMVVNVAEKSEQDFGRYD